MVSYSRRFEFAKTDDFGSMAYLVLSHDSRAYRH
jgi:hypothetical protein